MLFLESNVLTFLYNLEIAKKNKHLNGSQGIIFKRPSSSLFKKIEKKAK